MLFFVMGIGSVYAQISIPDEPKKQSTNGSPQAPTKGAPTVEELLTFGKDYEDYIYFTSDSLDDLEEQWLQNLIYVDCKKESGTKAEISIWGNGGKEPITVPSNKFPVKEGEMRCDRKKRLIIIGKHITKVGKNNALIVDTEFFGPAPGSKDPFYNTPGNEPGLLLFSGLIEELIKTKANITEENMKIISSIIHPVFYIIQEYYKAGIADNKPWFPHLMMFKEKPQDELKKLFSSRTRGPSVTSQVLLDTLYGILVKEQPYFIKGFPWPYEPDSQFDVMGDMDSIMKLYDKTYNLKIMQYIRGK
jgi:hypothetical protein